MSFISLLQTNQVSPHGHVTALSFQQEGFPKVPSVSQLWLDNTELRQRQASRGTTDTSYTPQKPMY